MTTEERVQKLESLLARVKARAAEPRVVHASAPVETSPAFAESTPAQPTPAPVIAALRETPPFVVPPHVARPRRPVQDLDETQRVFGRPRELDAPFAEDETRKEAFAARVPPKAPSTTPPPTASYTEHEVAAAEAEGLTAAEAEALAGSEEVEVDIDVDEDGLDEAELAAVEADAAAAAPAELEVVTDEDDEEMAAADTPRPANEIEEPEPSSSPRPIVEAHEPEATPRHTPPPESGKQVAASAPPRAPSAFPPPAHEPSIAPPPVSEPPDSLGGHTLIGGWREPGLGPGGPGVGVRVPAPPANVPSPISIPPSPITASQPFVGASTSTSSDFTGPKPARSGVAVPPPVQAKAPLSAEKTEPDLGPRGDVVRFEGQAPAFAPASFGELLDATLGL